MNKPNNTTEQPEQPELKIEDLPIEDSPDAEDENIKGGVPVPIAVYEVKR